MHSLPTFAAVFATVLGLAVSQAIDPSTVPAGTRQQWCTSQISACPLLCTQQPGGSAATDSNTCDATSLAFSCVCGNGITPNASQYSQTIPYFLCTQTNTNCVNNCGGDSSCQSACRDDNPCGAQNPTRVNTSTISTMSATATSGGSAAGTASGGAVFTGFGGGSAATTAAGSSSGSGSKKSAASAMLLNIGQVYGLGLVAASFLAGFTMML